MQRDIRQTSLYKEAESLYRAALQPGTGQIADAAELDVSADGKLAVFSGTLADELEGIPPTRIGLTDLATGNTRVLTFGPNVDRLPKFSPVAQRIAFLSDRHASGDFQLYLLNPVTGAVQSTPRVTGWVEYLHWSPDGRRILLAVAAHGADVAGGQGGITSRQVGSALPAWMPVVESGDESHRWRRAWIYDTDSDRVSPVDTPGCNLWEVVWCGNETLAAVASPTPGEGGWYRARLHTIDVATGASREIYAPRDQLGWPSASPSGKCLAIVEALSSDRWIVAGDLRLVDLASGEIRAVSTRGVDVTCTEWCSDRLLLIAGHRGFETVVGLCDAVTGTFNELWCSSDLTTGGRYATVCGFGEAGDCALIVESFARPPEIALIQGGKYRQVKSFALSRAAERAPVPEMESVTWQAPDGLEIQGWLLRPKGAGPHPLVMNVHGGPVWHWRQTWSGRGRILISMLLEHGYAVFFPNPRGSAGRGQDFARRVAGDVGGADAHDCLSGLDHLVHVGIADATRLGVMGGSYGGFMVSWLVTQDTRFAAAVSIAPHTNHVTAHLLSYIPDFVALFVGDKYSDPAGRYFTRSPVMYAHKAKTPTLNICGALDRSAPPAEAMQFHNALLENGARSVLVTYPEEGHGVRNFPTAMDYVARIVAWFEQHMPARR